MSQFLLISSFSLLCECWKCYSIGTTDGFNLETEVGCSVPLCSMIWPFLRVFEVDAVFGSTVMVFTFFDSLSLVKVQGVFQRL